MCMPCDDGRQAAVLLLFLDMTGVCNVGGRVRWASGAGGAAAEGQRRALRRRARIEARNEYSGRRAVVGVRH
jgi:hypothetical protein